MHCGPCYRLAQHPLGDAPAESERGMVLDAVAAALSEGKSEAERVITVVGAER